MQPISKCSTGVILNLDWSFFLDQSKSRLNPTKKQNRTYDLTSFTAFSRLSRHARRVTPPYFFCAKIFLTSFLVLGRHSDNLMTSRMTFCSKNIETVPLFYCNFDSISFCVLTTSVLIRDCNFKTTSTFLSVVSFKVYSTKISSSQEYDDKYV